MRLIATLLLLMTLGLPGLARAEVYLLMAEQHGCVYCDRWDSEISHIYPKTDLGRSAPLRRYNIRNGVPDGVELSRRVTYTPTFLLIRDGVEAERLEGYPGPDFFWGVMEKIFERARIPVAPRDVSGG